MFGIAFWYLVLVGGVRFGAGTIWRCALIGTFFFLDLENFSKKKIDFFVIRDRALKFIPNR